MSMVRGGMFMTNSLSGVIKDYANSNAIRFHMPGHNGSDIKIDTSMDITELSFSDNLISATGIISDTEKLIASAYNMNYALMLTSGATSGIAIAMYCASLFGSNVAIVGNAHKSVYNYANIFALKTHNINCEKELEKLQDLSAVIITSPDYFGMVTDYSKYKGKHLLIIDQSHGAHFAFSSKLPDISSDADILITSWHKTLPVLTGGAVMTCNNDDIYTKLLLGRNILHSSSPNYMIMSSIDNCVRGMINSGEILYENAINAINIFKNNLPSRYEYLPVSDPTRLVISLKGVNASSLASILEKYNIFLEMSYLDKLIAIITPYNHQHLPKFLQVLQSINLQENTSFDLDFDLVIAYNYDERKSRLMHLNDCCGMVCMTSIGVYPPGVPIINKGQVINAKLITFLTENINDIFGLITGKIFATDNTKE